MCNKDPSYVFIEKRKPQVGGGDATSWGNTLAPLKTCLMILIFIVRQAVRRLGLVY